MATLINKRLFKQHLLSLSALNASKRNEARKEMGLLANLKPCTRVSEETYNEATSTLLNWMKNHVIETKKGKTL